MDCSLAGPWLGIANPVVPSRYDPQSVAALTYKPSRLSSPSWQVLFVFINGSDDATAQPIHEFFGITAATVGALH